MQAVCIRRGYRCDFIHLSARRKDIIIDVWSWTPAPGKLEKATDFLKRVAQYHTGQGINTRVLRPDCGPRGVIEGGGVKIFIRAIGRQRNDMI